MMPETECDDFTPAWTTSVLLGQPLLLFLKSTQASPPLGSFPWAFSPPGVQADFCSPGYPLCLVPLLPSSLPISCWMVISWGVNFHLHSQNIVYVYPALKTRNLGDLCVCCSSELKSSFSQECIHPGKNSRAPKPCSVTPSCCDDGAGELQFLFLENGNNNT